MNSSDHSHVWIWVVAIIGWLVAMTANTRAIDTRRELNELRNAVEDAGVKIRPTTSTPQPPKGDPR